MKIGIVTLWDSNDNYGQILQCYALQYYLYLQGHEAELIKVINDTDNKKKLVSRILRLPFKFVSFRFWSLLVFRVKSKKFAKIYGNVDRGFERFRRKYIHTTDKVYDLSQLKSEKLLYDAYITGSDQVWGSLSKVFFLDFVESSPKYSYAASFGSNPFSKEGRQFMKRMLESFNCITVREQFGVKQCATMGFLATRVIDPTGLLSKDDYLEIAHLPKEKGYVLIYLLGNFTDVNIKSIYQFAKERNIEVKYVASQARNDCYDKIFPSPSEWLGLIANAEYVFTNSYHCCMFSMYFEKKFKFFKLNGIFRKMNTRMETLLTEYSIPWIDNIDDIDEISFDYQKINQKFLADKDKAVNILKTWFK